MPGGTQLSRRKPLRELVLRGGFRERATVPRKRTLTPYAPTGTKPEPARCRRRITRCDRTQLARAASICEPVPNALARGSRLNEITSLDRTRDNHSLRPSPPRVRLQGTTGTC